MLITGAAMISVLAGCGGSTPPAERDFPASRNRGVVPEGSVFGSSGVTIGNFRFGGDGSEPEPGQTPGGPAIGVNSYLWRGALDTVSFMPVTSADPFGGVILTDWYTPPEAPGERFKVNVYILGRELRADGIRVAVFRQTRAEGDTWIEAEVDPATPNALEETILTRARELRVSALAAQ